MASSPPTPYGAAAVVMEEMEERLVNLVKEEATIEDRDQRGAAAQYARRVARAASFLAESYELLSDPPIDRRP